LFIRGGGLILRGYDNEEVVVTVGVSVCAVKKWRQKLKKHNDDLHVLVRKKGSGKKPSLTDEQKQQLKDIILAGAIKAGYPCERWTSRSSPMSSGKHLLFD
jgi:transposase